MSITVAQIKSLVEQYTEEDLADMTTGMEMNEKPADYGLEHALGIGIASSLLKQLDNPVFGDSLSGHV